VPHSSVEAGERALPDPVERRRQRVVDPEPGTTPRASNLPACHRKDAGSCEGQRIRNVTSRMRLRRARPELWERGGQPPARPGPVFPVWQGRLKAFLIEDDDHLVTVPRSVERNASRAELVARAEEWKWSSLPAWQRRER
jgi:hypothetical protein